jgi:hypothetical protein
VGSNSDVCVSAVAFHVLSPVNSWGAAARGRHGYTFLCTSPKSRFTWWQEVQLSLPRLIQRKMDQLHLCHCSVHYTTDIIAALQIHHARRYELCILALYLVEDEKQERKYQLHEAGDI